jgi:hypothetical protein
MPSPQSAIESVLDNTYVSGFIRIFIILYAVLAAPQLPPWISKLFHHSVFQIVMFALIAYTATKDISISILIALAFFVSFHSYTRHLITRLSKRSRRVQKEAPSVDSSVSTKSEPVVKAEKFENAPKEPAYVQYNRLDVQQVQDEGLRYDEASLSSEDSDAKLADPYQKSIAAHPASGSLPGFGGTDYSAF